MSSRPASSTSPNHFHYAHCAAPSPPFGSFSSQGFFFDEAAAFNRSSFSSVHCGLEAHRGTTGDQDMYATRAALTLNYTRAVFRRDQTTPKFAWINVGTAHDYRPFPVMHTPLHRLDHLLTEFLAEFVRGHPEAVVVLMGDHGLQDGSGAVDWGSQIDHRNPFLGIIAPQSSLGAPRRTRTALSTNTRRLVTVHDLYATLAGVLHDVNRVEWGFRKHPPWAVDLLHNEVPADRSCRDVWIPPDFCSCQHEFTWGALDMRGMVCSPHEPHPTGICNPIDVGDKQYACCHDLLRPEF